MSEAIPWSESSIKPVAQVQKWSPLARFVFWQVAFVSLAAYLSKTLIFDEANLYRIDLYDAMTWGIVVTQVFTLAIYVSHNRVQSIESSLKIFLAMGSLATGLTIAATTFLFIDALRSSEKLLPLIGFAPSYCIEVFIFILAMFLQLRLAILFVQAIASLLFRKLSVAPSQDTLLVNVPSTRESLPTTSVASEPIDSEWGIDELENRKPDVNQKFSIADILGLTGLAAVSISAYRMVLLVADYDVIRFLVMFYAASITAICIYGLIQWQCPRWLKLLLMVATVALITYGEFQIAQQLRSPLRRFGFNDILICNCLIAVATTIQMALTDQFVKRVSPPFSR